MSNRLSPEEIQALAAKGLIGPEEAKILAESLEPKPEPKAVSRLSPEEIQELARMGYLTPETADFLREPVQPAQTIDPEKNPAFDISEPVMPPSFPPSPPMQHEDPRTRVLPPSGPAADPSYASAPQTFPPSGPAPLFPPSGPVTDELERKRMLAALAGSSHAR